MDPIPQGLRERKKIETARDVGGRGNIVHRRGGVAALLEQAHRGARQRQTRTFFRYFSTKEEVFIVDPLGKLAALHVALADGPPDEPTIAALRRGVVALAGAYFEPELIRAEARIALLEPAVAAAGLAYQVRWEVALALEVAADLGVDVNRDARPRIVAHTTVAILRAGVSAWFQGGCEGDPAEFVASTFDRTTPALAAVLTMPPA